MQRQVDTETMIIVLALAVVYLGYLSRIGNLATADVSVAGGLAVHSILTLCALAICSAILLKVRRVSLERSSRHGLTRHGLSRPSL